jgi:hypothetical protein
MTTTDTYPGTTTPPRGPTDPIGAELTRALCALKLGGMTATMPGRLALARRTENGPRRVLDSF